jgi:carboxyl-terminal processing protease
MRRSKKIAFFAVMLLPVVASGFLLQSRSRSGEVLLDQVLGLVSARFVDTLPEGTMYEKAARGLVRELNDPYSELLSPKENKQFSTRTDGRYGGLGMTIEPRDGQIAVVNVFPNTPAERGGVREGDRIMMVDTMSTKGWTTQKASDVLTGTPGTKVRVTFSRPGVTEPIESEFTRAIVLVPAVPFALMFGNVGYVKLLTFNEHATTDLEAKIRELSAKGAKGVIVDLRGNPGGRLEQSMSIANLFLQRGQELASVRYRQGAPQTFVAEDQPALPTTPLIVLTDERSASASEIVAGALQDHDRAVVVGQTSFGKGLVQSVYPLDGGWALKLTTAKWFTPSGRSIQRERKLVDGQFVEDTTRDSLETDISKKTRPMFRSDAGRPVYGGGGVTPDVIVPDDTLTTAEQKMLIAMGPKAGTVSTVLRDYALELSRTVSKDYQVQGAWVEELRRRLAAKQVDVDPQLWAGGNRYFSYELEAWVSRYAHGDSARVRRQLKYDAPLTKAIDMMNRGQTQKELFALATASSRTVTGGSPVPKNAAASRPPQSP